ncbi:UrcA family protein [Phenylobacterium sp.]|uniref:UrcA family protein n=1 Tax=Phenylobacterium sp. TaxID=1871053 RepID=UPI0035B30A8A
MNRNSRAAGMISLFAATAAACLAATAAPASAEDHSWRVGSNSYHLYFRDLNLANQDDRQEMLARVERAATMLCRGRYDFHRDEDACIAASVQQTAQKSPALRLAIAERGAARLAER